MQMFYIYVLSLALNVRTFSPTGSRTHGLSLLIL